ncbi:MAG: PIG-L family deacetylase [Aggregatilineales bacterium]
MHLFLSPHLDDAVLSCGGTIYQLTEQGASVSILTIMAGDPPDPLPDTPIVRDLHQRWKAGENPVAIRRQEDIAAAKILHASAQHREYGDCVYRVHNGVALYPSEESLFGEVHPDDSLPGSLAIEAALINYVFLNIEAIYAPLGVGHHVDHQIIRDWALEIYRRNPTIEMFFYEEYPYTRDMKAIENAFNFFPAEFNLTSTMAELNKQDVTAKIQAIACHQSQLSTFWKTRAEMIKDVRQSFYIGDGNFGERYWQITSGRNTDGK